MLILALIITAAGCNNSDLKNQTENKPIGQVLNQINVNDDNKTELLETLPTDTERRNLNMADNRKISLLVFKISKGSWDWQFFNNPEHPRNVRQWRELLNSNLVINGVYFDTEQNPTGFYMAEGTANNISWPDLNEQKNPGSYSSYISVIDHELVLDYLVANQMTKPSNTSTQVFLSFPTLLYNNQPLIKEDSQKYARRTVLAEDEQGDNYIIITESGVISLYEIANWLAAQPEKFKIAINLDGGPSTGISYYDSKQSLDIPSAPVPNIISLTQVLN